MDMAKNGIRYDVLADKALVLGFAKNGRKSPVLKIPASVFGKPVTEIVDEAFIGENIEELVVPISLKKIGYGAFRNCKNLHKVYTPRKNYLPCADKLFLREESFAYCTSLEYIQFEQRVHASNFVFFNSKNIKVANFYFSNIGAECFRGCEDLKRVYGTQHAVLVEDCLKGSAVTEVVLQGVADLHSSVVDHIKKNSIKVFCYPTSKLAELAYEGIEVKTT